MTRSGPDIYDRLGVKKVINAQSWVTALGGSIMRPEVVQAMAEASTCYVDMVELNRKAGEVVARACGAEGGMVTNGCSPSQTIAVASCMTGADPAKVERLPHTEGMKSGCARLQGRAQPLRYGVRAYGRAHRGVGDAGRREALAA